MIRRLMTVGAFALCVGIITIQGVRIRALQDRLEDDTNRGALPLGSAVPDFNAENIAGVRETITFAEDDRKTILYIFSPHCVWCARNSKSLSALSAALSPRYRVIGLSLDPDGVSEYVAAHDISFPVYTNISESTRSAFNLGPTPETIVVDRDGTVVQALVGAFVGSTKGRVERFFSIRLPDPS